MNRFKQTKPPMETKPPRNKKPALLAKPPELQLGGQSHGYFDTDQWRTILGSFVQRYDFDEAEFRKVLNDRIETAQLLHDAHRALRSHPSETAKTVRGIAARCKAINKHLGYEPINAELRAAGYDVAHADDLKLPHAETMEFEASILNSDGKVVGTESHRSPNVPEQLRNVQEAIGWLERAAIRAVERIQNEINSKQGSGSGARSFLIECIFGMYRKFARNFELPKSGSHECAKFVVAVFSSAKVGSPVTQEGAFEALKRTSAYRHAAERQGASR